MPEQTLISVLMPFHNAEPYLAQAIESILSQSEGRYEFLGLDDGSTDSSAAIFETNAQADARLRLIRCPRQGIVATLNAGIAASRARYIARMDADDVSLPGRFAAQLDYLERHPRCVVVGCGLRELGRDGRFTTRTLPTNFAYDRAAVPQHIEIAHPTTMIRRSALIAVGGYRAAFEPAEDADLWLRLLEVGDIANLPAPLLIYRRHAGQVTHRRAEAQAFSASLARTFAVARTMGGEPAWEEAAPFTTEAVGRLAATSTPRLAALLYADLAELYLHRAINRPRYLREAVRHLRAAAAHHAPSVRQPRSIKLLLGTVLMAARRGQARTAIVMLTLAMTASPLESFRQVAVWLARRARFAPAARTGPAR